MVALRLLLLVSAATLAVGHDDLRRQLRKKRSLPCNPKKDTSCCLDKLRTKRCQKLVAKRPRKYPQHPAAEIAFSSDDEE